MSQTKYPSSGGESRHISDREKKNLNTAVDDPLLKRKRDLNSLVSFYEGIPLPAIVEISESGTCNRVCAFCPRSAPDFEDKKEFISEDLIGKLTEELSIVNFSGTVIFSGFVEPLLDVSISNHVRTIRQALPNARIEMVSNGDPVTVKNLDKLYSAGLDALLVSCYDGEHQIDELSVKVRASTMPSDRLIFRKRWGSASENFGISLSNRGGLMSKAEFPIDDLVDSWDNPCFYPANTFFMDYNGDVLICAHDWGKKAIVGNLVKQSFLDIWAGEKFSDLRKRLLDSDREFSPCRVCNVEGTRMGIEHAEAWRKTQRNRL